MKPDLSRMLIGPAGLLIGALLYAQTGKLPEPQQHWAIGGLFALLGLTALWYGRREREAWVGWLGWALLAYGLLRAVLIR